MELILNQSLDEQLKINNKKNLKVPFQINS